VVVVVVQYSMEAWWVEQDIGDGDEREKHRITTVHHHHRMCV